MTNIGQLSVPRDQKQTGKKITTWSFTFPSEEKAEISVHLLSQPDSLKFQATSTHPLLKDKVWSSPDIAQLSELVQKDIQSLSDDVHGEQWLPVLAVEIKSYTSKSHKNHTQIEFSVDPLLRDSQTPKTNHGESRVIKSGRVQTYQETGHLEGLQTELPSGPLTRETSRELRRHKETPTTRSLVPQSEESEKALEDIKKTLDNFAAELGQALDPSRPNPNTVPSPQDLIQLMKNAAENLD